MTQDPHIQMDETVRMPWDPSHWWVRWIFLRALGIVYFTAFVSFWTQAIGLIGDDGIAPARYFLERVSTRIEQSGSLDYWDIPTLFHFIGISDTSIHLVCFMGTVVSVLLILGLMPRGSIAILWGLYLSLFSVSSPFLSYQWDILLLEVSVIAFIYAPSGLFTEAHQAQKPSNIGRWLVRLLLFKLMLSSGLVKLNSGDPTWQNLTALDFHYWTQPIPNPLSWIAHHMGGYFRAGGVLFNHFAELAIPWLILFSLPRRLFVIWLPAMGLGLYLFRGEYSVMLCLLGGVFTALLSVIGHYCRRKKLCGIREIEFGRRFAGLIVLALMLFVGLTGNYGFFNLLTAVLAITCFNDQDINRLIPWQLKTPRTDEPPKPLRIRHRLVIFAAAVLLGLNLLRIIPLFGHEALQSIRMAERNPSATDKRVTNPSPNTLWYWLHHTRQYVSEKMSGYPIVNGYGLFARMTTERFELVVEGSHDRKTWQAYTFRYKPDHDTDLRFAGLHMPRLDWQMWFAALYPNCSRRWIFGFMDALFDDSGAVHALLEHNPFLEEPPTFMRIRRHKATFRRQGKSQDDGYWDFKIQTKPYCPVVTHLQLDKANLTRSD